MLAAISPPHLASARFSSALLSGEDSCFLHRPALTPILRFTKPSISTTQDNLFVVPPSADISNPTRPFNMVDLDEVQLRDLTEAGNSTTADQLLASDSDYDASSDELPGHPRNVAWSQSMTLLQLTIRPLGTKNAHKK